MSLAGLRRALVSLLAGRDRRDLAREALDRVAFTDDGSTLYVHVLAKASWPRRHPGQAYVLAYADKTELRSLADYRALLREAWLLLYDEIDDIIRWFQGT